jgi:cytochrome c553
MLTSTAEEAAGGNEPEFPAPAVIRSTKRRGFPLSDTLFLILLLAVGSNGLLLANSSEELDRGRAIYREHCMDCHGETGKGDGVKAPFLSPRPGNLISAATSAKTDKELLRTIAQGKPRTAMPAWQDRLPAADQQSVLHYIRSLIRFTRSLTPPPPTP